MMYLDKILWLTRRMLVLILPLIFAVTVLGSVGSALAQTTSHQNNSRPVLLAQASNADINSGGDATTFSSGATKGAKSCTAKDVGGGSLLYLPHWWQYMKAYQVDTLGQCQPVFDFPSSLLPIGLAVLDILLRIAGFAAVVAIIISGINYMLAQGNSEKAGAARGALFNALIGLGIAFTASAAIAFIGKNLAS